MHYRTTYRGILRAAFAANPAFENFTNLSAWAQNISAETLPVFAIATPRETKELTTHQQSDRGTELAVVLKVVGGDDVEDNLDDLSVVVEQVTLEALDSQRRMCALRETVIDVDGEGESRVGSLTMTFTITNWLAEPYQE